MTKDERIQAIERYVDFIQKDAIKFANDKETLEEDKTHYATAIEEAIGVDDQKMAIEIRKLDYHKIGLVDCAKLAKAISTNKEVIKITERKSK